MSRRTKPKDPFREQRRHAVNEQLAERIKTRFASMYALLTSKHVPADDTPSGAATGRITKARAGELAADFALSNRAGRRRNFGERGDARELARTMAIPRKRYA
jgi:hypothetical protein